MGAIQGSFQVARRGLGDASADIPSSGDLGGHQNARTPKAFSVTQMGPRRPASRGGSRAPRGRHNDPDAGPRRRRQPVLARQRPPLPARGGTDPADLGTDALLAGHPPASPGPGTGPQLAVEAVRAAGHFGNSNAALNRDAQYMIVSPHNTHPDHFFNGSFCAWHDWNGDTGLEGGAATSTVGDVAFTNLPYVPDVGGSCWANLVNSGTAGALDGVTVVSGHEYAETITDQNPA